MAATNANARVLRSAIKRANLTIAEAASMIGVTERTLYAYFSPVSSAMHRSLSKRGLRTALFYIRGGKSI